MQKGHKLLQTAARLGYVPALLASSSSLLATNPTYAPCLICLRSVASLSQVPATNRQQQNDFGDQQHQRPLLAPGLQHQQHRRLFGIGEANDTQKDYKERRLIGYSKSLYCIPVLPDYAAVQIQAKACQSPLMPSACRYSPKQLYDVVAEVQHYKEFVPWCQRSHIIRKEGDTFLEAELEVGFRLFVERCAILGPARLLHDMLLHLTNSGLTRT